MNNVFNTGNRSPAGHRRGAIVLLSAMLSVVLLGMVAFAVDVGYILSNKQELQRAADAAALAACWEYTSQIANSESSETATSSARGIAADYAGLNPVGNKSPVVDSNSANSSTGDVVFGNISDVLDSSSPFIAGAGGTYNAVKVRIRRDSNINGEVPYFFARIFGLSSQAVEAEAIAGYVSDINGFQIPYDGSNIDILPFALDIDTWNDMLAGNASDDYTWDAENQQITCGSDGILEVNLYPQGTGSPGNRGTVDIGSSNNSTNDIARQILHGISPEDLEHHNGSLEFDDYGELDLNGDTGISAGVKDELAAIKGEPRLIPIFAEVDGPGNNAQYTIVKWAGVRIMYVKLTGSMSKKRLIIQPCPMVVPGVIPSTVSDTSDYVYSPVVLVR